MILFALDWAFILEKLILIAAVITVSLVVAMYATYVERKFAGFIQDRHGPNRRGSQAHHGIKSSFMKRSSLIIQTSCFCS